MSESVQNNAEVHIKEISYHGSESAEQVSRHVPPNFV